MRVIQTLCVAALLASSAAATAQVCVEVDTEQDNLADADRVAAGMLLRQTFEDQEVEVVSEGCMATYRVSHVRLGESITVTLVGPEGQRRTTAAGLEELAPVYSQLVYALLNDVEVGPASTNRTNVTQAQDAPRRVQTDNMFYVRLGGGAVFGAGVGGGPAFGIGYRFELDHVGIDASFFNMVIDQGDDSQYSDGGANGSFVKVGVLYFFNGIGQNSGYLGGGLSWGASALCAERQIAGEQVFECYSDSGLQGELTGGYELLRASTVRLFFEGNVVLPFYNADSDLGLFDDGPASRSIYTPTMTASIGLGFGRRHRGYR